MSSRKQPGVAFWATVVVVVGLMAYPLSFGPACWWFCSNSPVAEDSHVPEASVLYLPFGWIYAWSPKQGWLENAIGWYATVFRTDDGVLVPCALGDSVLVQRPPR
jgi:hypothetical protein